MDRWTTPYPSPTRHETRQRALMETSPSPNVELEGLEAAAHGKTPGTLPPGSLLGEEDLDAGLAQAAYAVGAGEALA